MFCFFYIAFEGFSAFKDIVVDLSSTDDYLLDLGWFKDII